MPTGDDIFNALFVIDNNNTDTDIGDASYPNFPDEKPSKVSKVAWIDKWSDGLKS